MHPRQFKEHWKLTTAELADLIGGYSLDGVQNWLRKTDPVKVPQSVLNHLSLLNAVYLFMEAARQSGSHFMEIFELAYSRRHSPKRRKSNGKSEPANSNDS